MAGRGSPPGVRQGGKKKGSHNHITADIRALAQSYGPAAIRRLALLSGLVPPKPADKLPATNAGTQTAAIKELMDRGYGKATQPLVHGITMGLEDVLRDLAREDKGQ
jgi:hypothetical protein